MSVGTVVVGFQQLESQLPLEGWFPLQHSNGMDSVPSHILQRWQQQRGVFT